MAAAVRVQVPDAIKDYPKHILATVPHAKLVMQKEFMECPPWVAKPKPGVHFEVLREVAAGDTVAEAQSLRPIMLDQFPYYFIGASKKLCDHHLEHPSISRVHCAILHHQKGNVFVVDLDSANGVAVNGRRVKPREMVELRDGDTIKLGGSSRKFTLRLQAPVRRSDAPVEDLPIEPNRKKAKTETIAAEPGEAPVIEDATVTAAAPRSRRVYHLLIKHKDTANPVSKAPRNKGEAVTRSLTDAVAMAEFIRNGNTGADGTVQSVAHFVGLVKQFSECASAKKDGDMGAVVEGEQVEAIDSAIFALPTPLSVSHPTTSELGVHLFCWIPNDS